MQISDQIVLVTGGARGLGLAISQTLIAEGARVVVNYLSSQTAAEQLATAFPQQVFAYQADVTDKAQVEQLFAAAEAHFGTAITSVVNNALIHFQFNGDARPKIEELTTQHLQQQFDGAVVAALNTTQAALPKMKAQGFGRIVNIGTNLVQNPVMPYHDYTAAKAALLAFTRTAAHELGENAPLLLRLAHRIVDSVPYGDTLGGMAAQMIVMERMRPWIEAHANASEAP